MVRFAVWSQAVFADLLELQYLKEGWDSYGASEIQPATILKALTLLHSVIDERTPRPSVVPTCVGGVHFEWYERGCELEIELKPDGKIEYFFERGYSASPDNSTTEVEGETTVDDLIEIRKFVSMLGAFDGAE